MVFVPVLYAIFFRAKYVKAGDPDDPSAGFDRQAVTIDMSVPEQAPEGAPGEDSPAADSPQLQPEPGDPKA